MVEINTEIYQKKLDLIQKNLGDYEENFLNMFNELLNNVKENWIDNIALVFNDKIYEEKINTMHLLNYTKDIKKILNYVYNKYQKLGKKIKCNLDSYDSVIDKLQYFVNSIDNILELFDKIDCDVFLKEKILNQKDQLQLQKNELIKIKENYKLLYKKINSIESDVKLKLSNLVGFSIEEFQFNIYNTKLVEKRITKAILMINSMKKSITKINYYIAEEERIIKSFDMNFGNLLNSYCSYNSGKLEKYKNNLNLKYNKLYNNRKKYVIVLNKNIEKYKNIEFQVRNRFNTS